MPKHLFLALQEFLVDSQLLPIPVQTAEQQRAIRVGVEIASCGTGIVANHFRAFLPNKNSTTDVRIGLGVITDSGKDLRELKAGKPQRFVVERQCANATCPSSKFAD